ncbi:enoyl-CoA hydratase/isomerase family protein [Asticcacaulis sp. AND118]|uniref:enoyl-CoA hydratase/isomerase family protein n=1 Tax=Asticcacaulis sp. AND118 TaxID=2840468 RepID=UPI001D000888|nr:enoyl-CoA hydratase/isomerase family protein [Asticcacaulis sp. AND118]UDF03248.1 enoyl-CoA hydratase/isomerase family protein [Asticcacaulis sp. AND118]
MSTLKLDISANGIARLTLNRPDRHNAFDEAMIDDLTQIFSVLGDNPAVRVVVLNGAGESFCAGGDLNWMQRAAQKTEAENEADALALATMLHTLNTCPKPVIGLIHGACFGGGVGLAACCDMVVAAPDARFGLTEVRLGLIPAAISPFVVAKIGAAARRYFLTGERFSADEARRIGLVHEVKAGLDAAAAPLIDGLLASGPQAVADAKALIGDVTGRTIDNELLRLTARRIAARRASDEGREGIAAFLEKRKPGWVR